MAKAAYIYNSKCLRCSNLEQKMIKIGPMIFCSKCFEIEFIETGSCNTKTFEVKSTSKEYQDWLKVYKKYIKDDKYEEEG